MDNNFRPLVVSAGKKFTMWLNCIFLTQIINGLQVCLIDSARKQGYGHKKRCTCTS